MGLFKKIEGEQAIVSSNGRFKQLDVYTWNGFLFAKDGAAFLRLNDDGSTSAPKVVLQQLTWTGELARDPYGRLALPGTPSTRALPNVASVKLLGVPDAS